jgi:hypothetical protein
MMPVAELAEVLSFNPEPTATVSCPRRWLRVKRPETATVRSRRRWLRVKLIFRTLVCDATWHAGILFRRIAG